jgi:hypothetical protein
MTKSATAAPENIKAEQRQQRVGQQHDTTPLHHWAFPLCFFPQQPAPVTEHALTLKPRKCWLPHLTFWQAPSLLAPIPGSLPHPSEPICTPFPSLGTPKGQRVSASGVLLCSPGVADGTVSTVNIEGSGWSKLTAFMGQNLDRSYL